MISTGANIRSSIDTLKKCSVEYLFNAIRNPKQEIAHQIRQLRIIRDLNQSQYSMLKGQLPYVVCGIFNPPIRKTENFAYTEYFIIDIDHISDTGRTLTDLKCQISKDPRIVLCFISPSGDGLKVMIKLKERCYDSNIYKLFYKLFTHSFSEQYNLNKVIDAKTCDVTRACFISSDPTAYYNPKSELVDINEFINVEARDNELFGLVKEALQQDKEQKTTTPKPAPDPDKDTIHLIRQTLNPNTSKQPKAPVYVPNELNSIIPELVNYIQEKGVSVKEIIDISYGKKMRFILGIKQAEINIFYGKRGFSVVQSPRTGTDAELNALMKDIIDSFIVEKL